MGDIRTKSLARVDALLYLLKEALVEVPGIAMVSSFISGGREQDFYAMNR